MAEPSSADGWDPTPENPDHMYGRSRAFQRALAAAKIDRRLQATILYVAHAADVHGYVRDVTLAQVAWDLGFDQRSGVKYALDAAQAAGFMTSESDPRDSRATVYWFPLMASPRFARSRAAQLREQLRGGSEVIHRDCAVADRAPYIEEVIREEGRERDITNEPRFDVAQLEDLHEQLRRKAAEAW